MSDGYPSSDRHVSELKPPPRGAAPGAKEVMDSAPLGTSRSGHLDRVLRDYAKNQDEARELLLEARTHARLTQNMKLVRRIDAFIEKVGVL